MWDNSLIDGLIFLFNVFLLVSGGMSANILVIILANLLINIYI
jgi:uncharacterized membrane protein